MANRYDKYIARLQAKRRDNPEYAFYRQAMQSLTETQRASTNRMQGQMTLAGASSGAIAQAGLSAQQQMQSTVSGLYTNIDRSAVARNDAIDDRIMALEDQRDAEKEQKKNELIKSGIVLGATAIGAGLGTTLIPGVGTAAGAMYGAQIGAGVGGIGASFVGGADSSALQQSIGDTLAGVSAVSTLKTHKDFADLFSAKYQYMSEKDKEMLKMFLYMNDIPGATALLKGITPASSTPESDTVLGQPDGAVAAAPGTTPESMMFSNKPIADGVYTIGDTNTDTFVFSIAANDGKDVSEYVIYNKNGDMLDELTTTYKLNIGDKIRVTGGNVEIISRVQQGTGKTYREWQDMVNKNRDMSPNTITMRNIESYKERGYWIDAKGTKKTSKPPQYDNYYGENAIPSTTQPRVKATYGDSNTELGVKQGNYEVTKGGQFSRNTKTGELVVKVNGSYYKVRVNGQTIKVKVGDKVTVDANGTLEVK